MPAVPTLRRAVPTEAAFDRGASGAPFTLQWNAEAIKLAGQHLLRAPVANRAYVEYRVNGAFSGSYKARRDNRVGRWDQGDDVRATTIRARFATGGAGRRSLSVWLTLPTIDGRSDGRRYARQRQRKTDAALAAVVPRDGASEQS
jgi:hypothetical protein